MKELLKKDFTKEKIRSVLQFLKLYIRFENQKLIDKFEIELDNIKNRQTTMGLEEFVLNRERRVGRKEGLEEGKEITTYEKDLAFTQSLLTQTDFSEEKIASLVGVDIEFVKKVKASLS